MKFKNITTGEKLAHIEFVSFIWEEAERQFEECHDNELWCNLTKEEQLRQYCEQFEHQINDRDWVVKM